MLTSKLHGLLNISAPCWWIFHDLLYLGDLLHHPLLPAFNLSLHLCFLCGVWRPYSSSSDQLHHPFDLLLCPIQMHLHIHPKHTYIHTCMLMCLTTIILCQMQSCNQWACYILANLSAILIPSASFPSKCYHLSMTHTATRTTTTTKKVIGIAQLSLSAVFKYNVSTE